MKETLESFVNDLDYDKYKIKTAYIMTKDEIILIGLTRTGSNEYITLDDIHSMMTECDAQFGFDENENLVNPVGGKEVCGMALNLIEGVLKIFVIA